MAEFGAGQERVLKQLISTFRCQVCRRSFDGEHVRVTARHEEIWIVSVRCGLCRNQQRFCVTLRGNESATPRDTSEAEEERFAALEPVGADDLLDMHVFLRGFDGDFKGLFSK